MYSLSVPEARSPRPKCQQGHVPPQALGISVFQTSLLASDSSLSYDSIIPVFTKTVTWLHDWRGRERLREVGFRYRKKESEVTQSCQTLCNPMDYNPSGSSIHRIFQARILEWVAISFSRGSSQPRDQTWVSHIASRLLIIWATFRSRR